MPTKSRSALLNARMANHFTSMRFFSFLYVLFHLFTLVTSAMPLWTNLLLNSCKGLLWNTDPFYVWFADCFVLQLLFVAKITVTTSFKVYNSGIYSESGNSNESQAVKIIGFTFLPLLISIIPIDRWGEDNSTPYWIIQNRYFFSIFCLYLCIFVNF